MVRILSGPFADFVRTRLDDAGRVELAYRLCYARSATMPEKERALKYLTETAKEAGGKAPDAWTSYCQVLLASAEFRYIR